MHVPWKSNGLGVSSCFAGRSAPLPTPPTLTWYMSVRSAFISGLVGPELMSGGGSSGVSRDEADDGREAAEAAAAASPSLSAASGATAEGGPLAEAAELIFYSAAF